MDTLTLCAGGFCDCEFPLVDVLAHPERAKSKKGREAAAVNLPKRLTPRVPWAFLSIGGTAAIERSIILNLEDSLEEEEGPPNCPMVQIWRRPSLNCNASLNDGKAGMWQRQGLPRALFGSRLSRSPCGLPQVYGQGGKGN